MIDLMQVSVRKVLNLTYAWLFDLIGGTEQWDKEYAHVFDPLAHEDFDFVDIPANVTSDEGKPKLIIGGM